jgi:hypothetical protein
MKKERLKVKYNSGHGAILCSGCSVILKVGFEYTDEELKYSRGEIDYFPPQYCEQCNNLSLKSQANN